MKRKSSRILATLKRIERKLLIKWMRFAQAHRESHRLPIFLFLLLFVDGFVIIVPSLVCLIAAVTISPARWLLFGTLAATGAVLNNIVTYFLGRLLPTGTLERLVELAGLTGLWDRAHQAIHDYGPFAAFAGSVVGLPTQMMTALIGISDAEFLRSNLGISSSVVEVTALLFLGHALKAISIAALTRYGWVRLERKIQKENAI